MLSGTGSDDTFVRSVFEMPLASVGITLVAPPPVPGSSLAVAALSALSDSASDPVVVGGISFGAHLAAEWAVAHPARCAGLVLALPAWLGVDGALASTDMPEWLSAELSRAWHGYGPDLAESLEVASSRPAPTLPELASLDVPVGIAACADDPIHPAAVATTWASSFPRAAVCTTRLAVVGADPEALGLAAVLAFMRAAAIPTREPDSHP